MNFLMTGVKDRKLNDPNELRHVPLLADEINL
jgi:hypothetical protein